MSRVFYHVCALKGICQFRGSLSTAPLTVSMKVREKASQVRNRLFKSKGAASQCPRFPDVPTTIYSRGDSLGRIVQDSIFGKERASCSMLLSGADPQRYCHC